ncbi:aromatic ring-hydroxylating oxygenase subunit alpha [Rhodococcus koreensis]
MTLLEQPENDIAERIVEHVRNGTTDLAPSELRVPISHFISEERLAREMELLRRVPIIIGRGSEIPDSGTFITREVMGVPLIIVRKGDGSTAAHVNVCKHRGGRVEEDDAGRKRFFTCKYHGWSYSRDGGDLRGVPYDEFYSNVDRTCHGLTQVKVEEKHGFLWADFSNNQERLIDDWLGDEVNAQLTSFGLEDAVIVLDKSFTHDINWKIVLDGAIDILHPKFLHPHSVGKMIATNTNVWMDYGLHGQVFSPRVKMEKLIADGEQINGAWRLISCNLFVYPNSMVIHAPDHVEQWTVWPDPKVPGRSTTQIRFLAAPEHIGDERMEARMAKSWEILEDAAVNEDWPMELNIQRGAEVTPGGTFLYGRNEQPCQHLHRQLARDLDGAE